METCTPQCYSTDEWRQNNYRLFNQAENSRADWKRIREQSRRLIHEKEHLTTTVQENATKKLADRARETREWKNKLERTIEGLATQIYKLEMFRLRLRNSVDNTEKCLIVVNECLQCRKQRVSTDLVEDQVNRELEKESEMVETFKNMSVKLMSEVDNQLGRNHAAKKALEQDWSNKWEAYNIDTTCGMMKVASSDQIAFYPGAETIPPKWSTPEEWAAFTMENINLGNAEIELTYPFAILVEDHLRKSVEDLQRQADVVNCEFRRRNMELNDSLYRLGEHLRLIGDSIAQGEATINGLRQSLLEKEPALKKVQTRLHLRYARPNVELCEDDAHRLLVDESRTLASSVQSLQEQLTRAEAALSNMHETRRDIEREIAIKENTVNIDQSRCPKIRQNYPPRHDLLGF